MNFIEIDLCGEINNLHNRSSITLLFEWNKIILENKSLSFSTNFQSIVFDTKFKTIFFDTTQWHNNNNFLWRFINIIRNMGTNLFCHINNIDNK